LADVVEIGRARRPAFELLDQIDESLKSDSTIDERRRRELLGDVGVVRQQFKKQEPNVPAIAALLAPLGQMPSVVTPVRSLIDLINV
jgi:hypothetical protein